MDNRNSATASVKMQRLSPRKARLVADLFRYKHVREALGILHNTNKKASAFFIKLLNSAIANATNNHNLDATKLYVAQVLVNEGPTLKRFQPRSQGRAYSIFKRTSHLSITVEERN
ncbi:50S ribosomal protein L22 [Mycoplasmopsis columbinasalis]|uniref:Large ribosomal subunit protein uL22 n=1 Tax=Mycoplasmopsis columbinasalis TaxID=114880 RepID=A0A449BA15_9BACT|nr:50S ribosomal protein L22 [Mycoplasmopsis columbinasalis]VEU78042.1 50S ribosomal protein L22 [Mycoplasmopsis columbinasalis]